MNRRIKIRKPRPKPKFTYKRNFPTWLVFVILVALALANFGCSCTNKVQLEEQTVLVSQDGHGTGVLIANQYVLTCAHCVDGDSKIFIQFTHGRYIEAEVVHEDKERDLALLELPFRHGIKQCVSDIKPFQGVSVVGHPLAARWVTTEGYYCAASTKFNIHSARVNYGCSGSGVWDDNGSLVGIVQRMSAGGALAWCAKPDSIRQFLKEAIP